MVFPRLHHLGALRFDQLGQRGRYFEGAAVVGRRSGGRTGCRETKNGLRIGWESLPEYVWIRFLAYDDGSLPGMVCSRAHSRQHVDGWW